VVSAFPTCRRSREGADEAVKSGPSHLRHRLVGGAVVPVRPDGLLERPGCAAFPLQAVAVQAGSDLIPCRLGEEVPGDDEVEGGISGLEASRIQKARKVTVGDEQVGGDQVAVAHDVGVFSGQLPESGPHRPQYVGVEQAVAARDALVDPLVVVEELTASSRSVEPSTTGVPGSQVMHHVGQLERERGGVLALGRRGRGSGEPCLGAPRQRVPVSWASDVQWLRCRNRAGEHKLAGCRPLALQLGQHTVRIVVSKREPRSDTVADAEDRVDRAAAVDGDDIESRKRGELVGDQRCDLVTRDGDLVLMHPFHSGSSPLSNAFEYVVRCGAGGREGQGGFGDDGGVKRVSVVGSAGSGKSHLAARIAQTLDVPYVELDAIHHLQNWEPIDPDEFVARIEEITATDGWVIDGNYRTVVVDGPVWQRADTVVWLDLPRPTVMHQVIRRTLTRIIRRTELWNGNREPLRNLWSWDPNKSIIRWAWTQHDKYQERYGSAMESSALDQITFVRLRSHAAADQWLAALRA